MICPRFCKPTAAVHLPNAHSQVSKESILQHFSSASWETRMTSGVVQSCSLEAIKPTTACSYGKVIFEDTQANVQTLSLSQLPSSQHHNSYTYMPQASHLVDPQAIARLSAEGSKAPCNFWSGKSASLPLQRTNNLFDDLPISSPAEPWGSASLRNGPDEAAVLD